MRTFFRLARGVGATALCAALLGGAAPVDNDPPLKVLSLGGVTIGASVLDAVKRFGAPDVVRTTDSGHEWQWVAAGGLDREVLADDDMNVHQVLVARPARIAGQSPAALVQPAEFAALGVSVDDAASAIARSGGDVIAEPDPAIRGWALPGGVVIAELENSVVGQLLALDDIAARRLGYLRPAPPAPTPATYRAPVLTKDFYAPYPTDAWRRNIEGTAVIRVLVDASGAAKEMRIVVPSGNDEIDAAALDSVRKSTFRPARCDGVPCAGVYFDLQDYSLIR